MRVGKQLTLKVSKPYSDIQCHDTMGPYLLHAAQGQPIYWGLHSPTLNLF